MKDPPSRRKGGFFFLAARRTLYELSRILPGDAIVGQHPVTIGRVPFGDIAFRDDQYLYLQFTGGKSKSQSLSGPKGVTLPDRLPLQKNVARSPSGSEGKVDVILTTEDGKTFGVPNGFEYRSEN